MINIYQGGTADSQPKIRLNGDCVNPRITLLSEQTQSELLVSDFSMGWSGGSDDPVNYQVNGLARKLTSQNNVASAMTYVGMDLSDKEFVTFYFFVDNKNNMDIADNYVKFKEVAGVDEFTAKLSDGNKTIRNGWNYFILLKDQFESIGSPSWGDITEIEFKIKSTIGTELNVTFAQLYTKSINFYERRLALNLTLPVGTWAEFDIKNGTVLRSDGADLSAYVTIDSEWFALLPKQNLLIYESDTDPLISWEYPTQPFSVLWNDTIM